MIYKWQNFAASLQKRWIQNVRNWEIFLAQTYVEKNRYKSNYCNKFIFWKIEKLNYYQTNKQTKNTIWFITKYTEKANNVLKCYLIGT